MKTLYALLTAMALCLPAAEMHAQSSFQHFYGDSHTSERTLSGCVSSFNGSQSHCLVGTQVDATIVPNVHCIAVARPDLTGKTINADNFRAAYTLTDYQNNVCDAEGIAITEFDNAGKSGFAITGTFVSRAISGIFLLAIDEFGTPIGFKSFEFMNVDGERPAAITYNYNAQRFVIAGTVPAQFPNDPTDIFVTAVDLNFTPNASYVLDVWPNPLCGKQISSDKAFDIVWDPFSSSEQYYVVGSCNDQWGQEMGFMVGLDGFIAPNMLELYTTGYPDLELELYSINPVKSDKTFIIGGRYRDARNLEDDGYVMKVDEKGKILWYNVYDYAPKTKTNNFFRDVKEVNDHFMALGTAEDGFFGKRDIHLVEMDSKGNKLPMSDYTFGTSEEDYAADLEVEHGLYMIAGTGFRGLNDFYLLHSDLSSSSACSIRAEDPVDALPYVGSYSTAWRMIPFLLNTDMPEPSLQMHSFDQQSHCTDVKPQARKTIARAAESTLYPNPATDRCVVQLDKDSKVLITDAGGRKVYETAAPAGALQISTASWSAGLYLVYVSDSDGNRQVHQLMRAL